jgi:hypothetical protein
MLALKTAAFLAAVPMVAAAQPAATPPAIEQAVGKAYMAFCLPLVAKEATNTEEVARSSGYQPTPLPNFSGLKVRSASAWLTPSLSGRVVVSRGSADERAPQSCEITVSGSPGAPLGRKLSEMLVCSGCPFVRNAQASQERNGLRMEKYDWKMAEKKALLSVMAITLPDSAPANFFVHVHMVR